MRRGRKHQRELINGGGAVEKYAVKSKVVQL